MIKEAVQLKDKEMFEKLRAEAAEGEGMMKKKKEEDRRNARRSSPKEEKIGGTS